MFDRRCLFRHLLEFVLDSLFEGKLLVPKVEHRLTIRKITARNEHSLLSNFLCLAKRVSLSLTKFLIKSTFVSAVQVNPLVGSKPRAESLFAMSTIVTNIGRGARRKVE